MWRQKCNITKRCKRRLDRCAFQPHLNAGVKPIGRSEWMLNRSSTHGFRLPGESSQRTQTRSFGSMAAWVALNAYVHRYGVRVGDRKGALRFTKESESREKHRQSMEDEDYRFAACMSPQARKSQISGISVPSRLSIRTTFTKL